MTLLAQQGYGKSDKIERGLRDGFLGGVVLSPRDLNSLALQDFAKALREEFGRDVTILFDPQFYASVIPDATDRNLPEYPYYRSALRRSDFLAAKSVTGFVKDALQFQAEMDLSRIIAPTVAFDSFSEPASQTALQLAAEAVENRSDIDAGAPLLISFLIGEAALADSSGVDEFLDIASTWETDGYYLIIEPTEQAYPASLQSDRLANLMYIVYTLATVNEYEVVLGYSDFSGLLHRAVGASAHATGWFGGLRQFSRNRWQPATGGRAARTRYSSAPLLNSILQIPELSAAYQAGLLELCLSESAYDAAVMAGNPADADWDAASQCLQHWDVLSTLSSTLGAGSVADNISHLTRLIERAENNYAELIDAGVTFDRLSGSGHLGIWSEAIHAFSSRVTL